jgi:hypothetical protein
LWRLRRRYGSTVTVCGSTRQMPRHPGTSPQSLEKTGTLKGSALDQSTEGWWWCGRSSMRDGPSWCKCASETRSEVGTERNFNNPVGALVSHSIYTFHARPWHQHSSESSFISSLRDHCPSRRPPAQDYCEQIEDLPTLKASRSTPPGLSPTPFPPFELWTATINSSRDGATLRQSG